MQLLVEMALILLLPKHYLQAYTALVTTLTSAGAKGVVANIPDVTGIPFLQQFLTIQFH
jgi:hypothetical protein